MSETTPRKPKTPKKIRARREIFSPDDEIPTKDTPIKDRQIHVKKRLDTSEAWMRRSCPDLSQTEVRSRRHARAYSDQYHTIEQHESGSVRCNSTRLPEGPIKRNQTNNSAPVQGSSTSIQASGSLTRNIYNLWKNRTLCDVTITAGGEQFFAHRLVLAASCDYFDRHAGSNISTEREIRFDFPDVSADVMKEVLIFFYTSNLHISQNNVEQLLLISQRLGIRKIQERCSEFLKSVNLNNALQNRLIASKFNLTSISKAIDVYLYEHFAAIMDSVSFLKSDFRYVYDIISSEFMTNLTELTIFHACVRWIDYNREERVKYAIPLMNQIRFSAIPASDIVSQVETVHFVFDIAECKDMLYTAFRHHALMVEVESPRKHAELKNAKTNREHEHSKAPTPSKGMQYLMYSTVIPNDPIPSQSLSKTHHKNSRHTMRTETVKASHDSPMRTETKKPEIKKPDTVELETKKPCTEKSDTVESKKSPKKSKKHSSKKSKKGRSNQSSPERIEAQPMLSNIKIGETDTTDTKKSKKVSRSDLATDSDFFFGPLESCKSEIKEKTKSSILSLVQNIGEKHHKKQTHKTKHNLKTDSSVNTTISKSSLPRKPSDQFSMRSSKRNLNEQWIDEPHLHGENTIELHAPLSSKINIDKQQSQRFSNLNIEGEREEAGYKNGTQLTSKLSNVANMSKVDFINNHTRRVSDQHLEDERDEHGMHPDNTHARNPISPSMSNLNKQHSQRLLNSKVAGSNDKITHRSGTQLATKQSRESNMSAVDFIDNHTKRVSDLYLGDEANEPHTSIRNNKPTDPTSPSVRNLNKQQNHRFSNSNIVVEGNDPTPKSGTNLKTKQSNVANMSTADFINNHTKRASVLHLGDERLQSHTNTDNTHTIDQTPPSMRNLNKQYSQGIFNSNVTGGNEEIMHKSGTRLTSKSSKAANMSTVDVMNNRTKRVSDLYLGDEKDEYHTHSDNNEPTNPPSPSMPNLNKQHSQRFSNSNIVVEGNDPTRQSGTHLDTIQSNVANMSTRDFINNHTTRGSDLYLGDETHETRCSHTNVLPPYVTPTTYSKHSQDNIVPPDNCHSRQSNLVTDHTHDSPENIQYLDDLVLQTYNETNADIPSPPNYSLNDASRFDKCKSEASLTRRSSLNALPLERTMSVPGYRFSDEPTTRSYHVNRNSKDGFDTACSASKIGRVQSVSQRLDTVLEHEPVVKPSCTRTYSTEATLPPPPFPSNSVDHVGQFPIANAESVQMLAPADTMRSNTTVRKHSAHEQKVLPVYPQTDNISMNSGNIEQHISHMDPKKTVKGLTVRQGKGVTISTNHATINSIINPVQQGTNTRTSFMVPRHQLMQSPGSSDTSSNHPMTDKDLHRQRSRGYFADIKALSSKLKPRVAKHLGKMYNPKRVSPAPDPTADIRDENDGQPVPGYVRSMSKRWKTANSIMRGLFKMREPYCPSSEDLTMQKNGNGYNMETINHENMFHTEQLMASNTSKTTLTRDSEISHHPTHTIVVIGSEVGFGSQDRKPSFPVQQYDPEENVWKVQSHLPMSVNRCGTTVLRECIYVCGGLKRKAGRQIPVKDCHRYNPSDGHWDLVAPLITARAKHVAVSLKDRIYVVGGEDMYGFSCNTIEMYDITIDNWSIVSTVQQARSGLAAVVHRGKIMMAGGMFDEKRLQDLCTVEQYDPVKEVSSFKCPLPIAICDSAMADVNDSAFLVGGYVIENGEFLSLDSVLRYLDDTDCWEIYGSLSIPRHNAVAVGLNHMLYVVGGQSSVNKNEAIDSVECMNTTFGDQQEIDIAPLLTPVYGISGCTLRWRK